jgi:hypothetical protein
VRREENPEKTVKVRSLVVLPVVALVAVGLAGCDSKAGAAAVINGHKITETQLADYLTPQVKPIPLSTGDVPARTFVLRTLIGNEVVPAFLTQIGAQVTDAELNKAKAALLQGSSEDAVVKQVTGIGLSAKFVPVYLRGNELSYILQRRFSSQQQYDDALKKFHPSVTVNRRYGTWDAQTLSMSDFSRSQLPGFISYDGTFPNDQKQSQ